MARGFVTAGTLTKWRVVSGASTFTTIPNVREAPGGGSDKADIDVQALSDNARVSIGGTVTLGEVTIKVAWDPTNAEHVALNTAAQTAGTVSDLQFEYPQVSGTCKLVNTGGYFKGGGLPTHNLNGALEMEFTYVPSGAWVFTA